jgi:tetratricopeptide (TPR) repeat protein
MRIEEKYELFEAYLDKSLSADEQVAFDVLMQSDAEKKEFEFYCNMQNEYVKLQGIHHAEAEFREQLKQSAANVLATNEVFTNQKAGANKNPFLKSHLRSMALAACLALIAGIFLFKDSFSGKDSTAQLLATNYQIEPLSAERGSTQDSLISIINLFNQKNYKQALPEINAYVKVHADDLDLQIAAAICNIELNDFAAAEQSLNTIINSDNLYKEKAEWYLAMCYLKQDKKKDCKDILQSFKADHFYKTKALTILKNL